MALFNLIEEELKHEIVRCKDIVLENCGELFSAADFKNYDELFDKSCKKKLFMKISYELKSIIYTLIELYITETIEILNNKNADSIINLPNITPHQLVNFLKKFIVHNAHESSLVLGLLFTINSKMMLNYLNYEDVFLQHTDKYNKIKYNRQVSQECINLLKIILCEIIYKLLNYIVLMRLSNERHTFKLRDMIVYLQLNNTDYNKVVIGGIANYKLKVLSILNSKTLKTSKSTTRKSIAAPTNNKSTTNNKSAATSKFVVCVDVDDVDVDNVDVDVDNVDVDVDVDDVDVDDDVTTKVICKKRAVVCCSGSSSNDEMLSDNELEDYMLNIKYKK